MTSDGLRHKRDHTPSGRDSKYSIAASYVRAQEKQPHEQERHRALSSRVGGDV